MYDFITAYENLLRDGQTPAPRRITISNAAVSSDGAADTVWCFAKQDNEGEIYHFINLIGTDTSWRDEKQTKRSPDVQKDLHVRLYTEVPVKAVYLASPDTADLSAHWLPFEHGGDENGAYVEFVMPELAYWNMVFLR